MSYTSVVAAALLLSTTTLVCLDQKVSKHLEQAKKYHTPDEMKELRWRVHHNTRHIDNADASALYNISEDGTEAKIVSLTLKNPSSDADKNAQMAFVLAQSIFTDGKNLKSVEITFHKQNKTFKDLGSEAALHALAKKEHLEVKETSHGDSYTVILLRDRKA